MGVYINLIYKYPRKCLVSWGCQKPVESSYETSFRKEHDDMSSTNQILSNLSYHPLWVGVLQTMSNSSSRKESCMIPRLLPIGGIMCFIHGLMAVAYYISATEVVEKIQN
ncbi:hypothetical protein LIER_02909 [Lithospermum erythrorhizon]|uniref:Uncharacterized protein n=1 Tax=Lithospermum erythrorhizon TaxID=34254 RepID=A0AAV3NTX0_LITER